jgi:hypothetical protein
MRVLRRIPLTRFGWVVVLATPLLLVIAAATGTGFVAGLAAMLALFLILLSIGGPTNARGRSEDYRILGR